MGGARPYFAYFVASGKRFENFQEDEQLAPLFHASKIGPCSLSPLLL